MNEILAYNRFSSILNELNPYSIKLGLERVEAFCKKIGNPQDSFPSILVGGTNGKGSVCQYLTDCFIEGGYTCGTYTSPHLILPNERFRINNRPVDFSTLVEYAEFIQKVNFEGLTYFEFLTVLMFLLFKDFGVDVAVLEVGMGGEFDATNVSDPILSILTSISMDHEEHLGRSLKEITSTKAKIIKRMGVVSQNPKEVIETIQNVVNVPVYFVDKRYTDKAKSLGANNSVNIDNVAVSMLSIDTLKKFYGYNLEYDPMKRSFWPGRFEILETEGKIVILDGAHNESAVKNLKELLKEKLVNFDRSVLVFSTLKTKKWRGNLWELMGLFDAVYLVRIGYRLGEDPATVAEFVKSTRFGGKVEVFDSVNLCINHVLNTDFQKVVITGSLYLVGEALACKIVE